MYISNTVTLGQVYILFAVVLIPVYTLVDIQIAHSSELNPKRIVLEEDSDLLAARFALQLIKGSSTREVALNKVFRTGDRFKFKIRPNRATYLYVVNIDPEGKAHLVWPPSTKSTRQTNNLIYPKQSNFIPNIGNFKFEGPTGNEWLLVVLSPEKKQLDLNTFLKDLPQYRKNPNQMFEYKIENNTEKILMFSPKGSKAPTVKPDASDPGFYGSSTNEGNVTLVYPYLLKHKTR